VNCIYARKNPESKVSKNREKWHRIKKI